MAKGSALNFIFFCFLFSRLIQIDSDSSRFNSLVLVGYHKTYFSVDMVILEFVESRSLKKPYFNETSIEETSLENWRKSISTPESAIELDEQQ